MIEGVTQQAPPTDGIDWQNGDQVMQYQLSQNEWIRAMVDQIAKRANEPKYITLPDGRTLADITKGQPWSGVVWVLDTTLSEAYRECAKNGFVVMDGAGGTQDMRGQFVRGAASGSGAGTTGGASEVTTTITVDNHAVHTHTAFSGAPSASTCCLVTCASGPSAGTDTHTHTITVNNNSAQSHTVTNDTFDILPPFYEMIFARKK